MKLVTILGVTGSVGQSTCDLIRRNRERYQLVAVTAATNVSGLAAVAHELGASLAVIADESRYSELKTALAGSKTEAAAGRRALVDAARRPVDWVMAAIVGAAGLEPVLAAVRPGTTIAFANKEVLVCAGDLITREARKHGATLLPVDSEHNAIFQVFDPRHRSAITRITLTASGGPFRAWDRDRMATATPEQAVAHPVWSMGKKISVDSATMMNKGLEIIEAVHLFDLTEDRIAVLIHPQSVVHGMVEYADGSVLAQMGAPDMRIPIAHALAWPERLEAAGNRLDLTANPTLTFEAPDSDRFPALQLAREAVRCGRSAPTVLNAANEVAVAAFLDHRANFLDIERIVQETLSASPMVACDDLASILEVDREARRISEKIIQKTA